MQTLEFCPNGVKHFKTFFSRLETYWKKIILRLKKLLNPVTYKPCPFCLSSVCFLSPTTIPLPPVPAPKPTDLSPVRRSSLGSAERGCTRYTSAITGYSSLDSPLWGSSARLRHTRCGSRHSPWLSSAALGPVQLNSARFGRARLHLAEVG